VICVRLLLSGSSTPSRESSPKGYVVVSGGKDDGKVSKPEAVVSEKRAAKK